MKSEPFLSPENPPEFPGWAPALRLAHDYRIAPGTRIFGKTRIGDHALHYFHAGSGRYRLGGGEYPIAPGGLFLVRPGEGYRFQLDSGIPVRMFNLHFDLESRPEFHHAYPCPDDACRGKLAVPPEWPAHRQLAHPGHYEELFQRLLAAAGAAGPAAELERRALLLEILALLYADAHAAPRSGSGGLHALRRALERIRREPARHATLDDLAKSVGVSRSLLAALCRRETGLSVQQHIRRERINKARYLLIFSELPLKEIAEACGFSDVHHFSRIFKELTGATPGAFRNRHTELDEQTKN